MEDDQVSISSVETIDSNAEASDVLQRWAGQVQAQSTPVSSTPARPTTDQPSGPPSQQRAGRMIRRTLVHLRCRDVRVPSIPRRQRLLSLQDEGRVKVVGFTQTFTDQEVKRTVMAALPSLAGQEK